MSVGEKNSYSRQTLKIIIDCLPIGVYICRDGRVLFVNRKFSEILGLPHDSITDETFNQLVKMTPRGEAFAREIFEKVSRGELDAYQWDNPLIRPDGYELNLQGLITGINLDDGPAEMIIIRDITAQRLAEKDLIEKEELFRLIGENSSDFIYVHDTSRKLTYTSPGVEIITGYLSEEWSSNTGHYVVDGERKQEALKATREALETGIKQPAYLVDVKTKDGRIRVLEVNETPFFRKKQVAGIVGVARDITDRLEFQNCLIEVNHELERRNKELERANREMEAFMYTVSHDLKAPLVTLHGMADRLSHKLSGTIDEQSAHYLDRILVNVERLEELVLDLLELSRIGRIEEEKVRLRIEDVLKESMEECQGTIQKHNLKIEISESLGDTVYSRKRLRQVFTNLITNAAKYSSDDRPPVLNVSAMKNGDYLELSFTDNGRGIDEKFHDKIFQAFQRPGCRKTDEGTGIGLTVVKRIIEYNGGKIEVRSVLGKGTKFILTIPSV